jgi:AraC family transcriptional regulator
VRLGHGDFFGLTETRREVAGFSVVIAAADPDVAVQRHTHEDAHFILLLDGHYISAARDAAHLHAEPALLYNPPGTTHRDTFADRRGRFLGVSVSHARFTEATDVARPSQEAIRLWAPSALDVVHRLARTLPHDELAIEALCLELLATFVRDKLDTHPPGWLIRACDSLHDRVCEPLTVRDIAADAGVHPIYLARQFRRFFGCSPADYVRRRRIERAALLVRTTSQPLSTIAIECGFVDQSHFTRVFRHTFATSPAAYRRRHRGCVRTRPLPRDMR